MKLIDKLIPEIEGERGTCGNCENLTVIAGRDRLLCNPLYISTNAIPTIGHTITTGAFLADEGGQAVVAQVQAKDLCSAIDPTTKRWLFAQNDVPPRPYRL